VSGPARLWSEPASVERVELPDADVVLFPAFLVGADADRLFAAVRASTDWRQEQATMFGRRLPIPRLQAWHGDPDASYSYSHIALDPEPWTPPLAEIRRAAEAAAGTTFNSVLVNLYRDGRDSVGWHSDDEAELGPEPVIASVSLGATRRFQLRHRSLAGVRHQLDLTHGSLLLMRGPTQRHWSHQVPKTSRPVGPRINLTFRRVTV